MSTSKDGSKSTTDWLLSRRRVIKTAGVMAAGIAAPSLLSVNSAFASYPERPVKIIVANTPGGPSDLVGRMVAATLTPSLRLQEYRDDWDSALRGSGAAG